MIGLPLRTERLLLRDLCRDDTVSIYELFSDKKVMYFLDIPHPDIKYSSEYLVNVLVACNEKPRKRWELAIIQANTRLFVGVADLVVETACVKDGRADLSYYILPGYWNNGYATEASKALIKFGFEHLKVNKITAGCLKCNTKSEKVMIQCNMQKEAELKNHTRFNSEWVNRVEYAILKDDYFM